MNERFETAAINCYTGALTHCLVGSGLPVQESDLLALGDGFLWRAGRDEHGLPELTFAVEPCGIAGVEALGGRVERHPLRPEQLAEQLAELLALGPVVCWVNSGHLDYASLYTRSLGHLHTIVIEAQGYAIFDPLVVDLPPHARRARLTLETLRRALTDRVRTDEYDLMGHLHRVLLPARVSAIQPPRESLRRQASRFFDEPRLLGALGAYRRMNEDGLASGDLVQRQRLARRIFDHVKVLYVLPALRLLHPLCAGAAADRVDEETRMWKTIAILALKYEATDSPRVLERLRQRLGEVEAIHEATWRAILASPPAG